VRKLALLLLAVLAAGGIPAAAAPGAGMVTTINLPEDCRVEDAAQADMNGDGKRDLVLATHEGWSPPERQIRVHHRRAGRVCYVAEPDAMLEVTSDVVAFALGDVDPSAPGGEVVLFTAKGAYAWTPSAGERARPRKLVSTDFLWQLPDEKEIFFWADGLRDIDGDGLVDLLLPEPNGYRIAFQRRANGSSTFDDVSYLGLPGRGLPSESSSRGALRMKYQAERRRLRASITLGADYNEDTALAVQSVVPYPALRDWDGDGLTDVLAQTWNELLVWLQRKGGGFAENPDLAQELPLDVDQGRKLDFAFGSYAEDLDGNRKADCVILAGDRRSEDPRTQVLVYRQGVGRDKTPSAPLFGPKGRPQQLLLVGGFTGLSDIKDVDGNGLPDLVLASLKMDAVDAIRAAASGDLDAKLNVYLNRKGTLSRQPDLSHVVEVPIKGLRDVWTRITARFVTDLTGEGMRELLLRVEADRLVLYAVRSIRGKPIVLEKPLFELTVNKRAYLRVDEPPGKPVEILVLQKQTVLHVRFK